MVFWCSIHLVKQRGDYKAFSEFILRVLYEMFLGTYYWCFTQGGLFFCFMNRIVICLIVLCGIALTMGEPGSTESVGGITQLKAPIMGV